MHSCAAPPRGIRRTHIAAWILASLAGLASSTAAIAGTPDIVQPQDAGGDRAETFQAALDVVFGEKNAATNVDKSAPGFGTMIDLSGDNHVARAPGDNSKYGVVLTWVNGYWWNGVPQQVGAYGTACNAMYVIDRSGDATVNRATADFVRDFNTLSNAIGRTCRFPVLVHSIQNQYVGQCARATWNFQGYSFTTLCRQPIPNPNSRGTSIAYTAGAGISHYQPNTFIQRDFADYNTTYSHVGHELSHAMGLDHSPEPSSLMYPFITTGVKKGYNTGDLVALAAWYDTHVGP